MNLFIKGSVWVKDNIELPKYVSVDFYDEYMHISKRWRGISTIFMTLALLVWLYVTTLIGVEVFSDDRTPVIMVVFLLFFPMACSLLYSTAANWLNKTSVFVSKNAMEIKIGPVPWPGNKRVENNDIEQFYVKTRITGAHDNRQVNYELRFVEKNKNDVLLLETTVSKGYLLYVEQEIEKYLGIEDMLMPEKTNSD